jgi:hypothetical protein
VDSDELDVRLPERVDLAFPSSEKQFMGAIPTGSRVAIPMTGETILIGVYWQNGEAAHVDLDLSGIAQDGSKIGWNARLEHCRDALFWRRNGRAAWGIGVAVHGRRFAAVSGDAECV